MQSKPEDLNQTIAILVLTVQMIVESMNAYTLAISELSKRVEELENFMRHEQ